MNTTLTKRGRSPVQEPLSETEATDLEPVGSVDWCAPIPELKGSFPIVLYFATAIERDEFIRMVQEVQPGLVSLPLPNEKLTA